MNLLENSGYKDNNLYQTSSNMRNNMQFMQDLNQMAAYIQLPVKFNESKFNFKLKIEVNFKKLFIPMTLQTCQLKQIFELSNLYPLKLKFKLSSGFNPLIHS